MSKKEDRGIQRDKPPSTKRPRLRAVAATLLVVLMGLWFVLTADNSGAATPVLIAGLVLSLACLFLSASGNI